LWKTDGTAAGTTRVSDALVATFPAPVDVGGTLFFAGYDPARGWAVWKTDGTDAGTVKVKDVIPGPIDDRPTRLFDFNGALLFGDGAGLWKSDGTEAGTVLLSAAYSGSPIVVSGGVGYFAGPDGPATASLWRTDGTPAGTFRVGGPAPAELTDVNGTLFFKGTDSVAGAELWKSDGTPAGTVLVKDILPSGSSDPIRLTAFGDQLMFFARSAPTFPSAYRLWRSDGTAAGTVEVGHDITFPGGTAVLGDTFYFGASYAGGALGLFKSDGRTTTFVKSFDFDAPAQLVAANGKLYFVGNTRATGTELWASDGTPAGTVVVADLAPGPDGSRPSPLRLVGRTLYFGTDAGLWKLDVGAPHEVVGRHVFYNHSSFDGNNAAATAADDGAVATDKAALLPGRAATFANVTSYDKGINGVMVDITALPQNATLTPADFEVAGGTPPLTVSVRRGAGVDGSDRVTLTWPDYNPLTDPPTMALANGWLTVTVKANANTGLAAPDVFSFGNLIGETGDGTGASGWRVGAVDLGALKHTLNALRSITSKTDVNRDGSVNVLDLAVLKRNLNHALPPPGVVAAAATPRAPSVPLPLAVAASAQRARRIAEGLLA
jgi:ELWxxDGT repeat protein